MSPLFRSTTTSPTPSNDKDIPETHFTKPTNLHTSNQSSWSALAQLPLPPPPPAASQVSYPVWLARRPHRTPVSRSSTSRNPITGTTTTTRKTTTHPSGVGHHGHAGKGPLATKHTATRGTTTTRSKGVHTTGTQHRKPSMGDKISGGLMNLKGSLTGKPGVKVSCIEL